MTTLAPTAAILAALADRSPQPLTFGSLFAGIGGFDLGFHRAGMRCAWQVELDDAARSVLGRHFPDTARHTDVRDVGAHNLTPVDIIAFGSPCQDLSVAGRRQGFDGERSGLFFEAVRIIRELRPRHAIWENVPGALSSNGGRDFGAALDALADAGAVDLAWRVLDAQWFGVAQRRRRVFVVASFGDAAGAAAVLFEPESGGRDTPPRREAGEGIAASLTRGSASGRGVNPPGRRREDDVNLIPSVASTLGSHAAPRYDLDSMGAYIPTIAGALSTRYGKGVNTTADDGAVLAYGLSGQLNGSAEVVNNLQVPSSSGGGHPAMVGTAMAVRRLLPVECCRLQGFPDWWLDDLELSDSAKYRMLGNAVCVNVAEWIGRRIVATLPTPAPSLPPGDLIRALVAAGHADAEVRAAIWYLIDDGLLTLTRDFDIARQEASPC